MSVLIEIIVELYLLLHNEIFVADNELCIVILFVKGALIADAVRYGIVDVLDEHIVAVALTRIDQLRTLAFGVCDVRIFD